VEEIEFKTQRGLDKSYIMSLYNCGWIRKHQNVIIVGPTGAGKSHLGCALGHKACLEGFSTLYYRFSKLLGDLKMGRCDGKYLKMISILSKADVLILDDFGLCSLDNESMNDFLEIVEEIGMTTNQRS
jgi:DNA replication protein DnaC